ncbi:hypothetical protein [Leptospira neocaledonica]|uniref:Uncharacterized protein n=1 Tax=Leptospira neocaledonica TaxID=2023192 RepID=A0A2M9ZTU7_9LEPT|nr:hypothetical protein [Leptospira neocaledonica]PJZ75313.1 hypothetical protein CH365_19525 [Leptospira neocaledonica]
MLKENFWIMRVALSFILIGSLLKGLIIFFQYSIVLSDAANKDGATLTGLFLSIDIVGSILYMISIYQFASKNSNVSVLIIIIYNIFIISQSFLIDGMGLPRFEDALVWDTIGYILPTFSIILAIIYYRFFFSSKQSDNSKE